MLVGRVKSEISFLCLSERSTTREETILSNYRMGQFTVVIYLVLMIDTVGALTQGGMSVNHPQDPS